MSYASSLTWLQVWEALPADGVPEGLDVRQLHEDDDAEDDGKNEAERDQHDEDETAVKSTSTTTQRPASKEGRHRVNEKLLTVWLQQARGPIIDELRPNLAAPRPLSSVQTTTDAFTDVHVLQHSLNQLYNANHDTPRTSSMNIATLAGRVAAIAPLQFGAMSRTMLEDMLYRELVAVVHSIDMSFDECGLPHQCHGETGNEPLQERADELSAAVDGEGRAALDGNGTYRRPLSPPRGTVAVSEFGMNAYTTAAFPTLFPFGRGDFSDVRAVKLTWTQYSQHLMHYHDGRFARHDRFRYFMLNTHERQIAHEKAALCIRDHKLKYTVGELRQLSKSRKEEIAQKVDKHGATLRNTPAFFKLRRTELEAMIEQLGDPHVFATNSHADTYCPDLQRFIMSWAKDDFMKASDGKAAGCSAAFNPEEDGLNETDKHRRRIRNLKTYPHLVALFFHLKMELYVEHICRGIMKADAHWARYEWQSRGSTHVHYFLWLSDAPEITSILDRWTREDAARLFGIGDEEGEANVSEEQLEQLAAHLNKRAESAARINERAKCTGVRLSAVKEDELLAYATGTLSLDASDARDHVEVAKAAGYWQERCSRWNHAWNENDHKPDMATSGFGKHACSVSPHAPSGIATDCMECDVPRSIADDINAVRNASCRHTNCSDYCRRRDPKTGEPYCRFHFPQQPRDNNEKGVPYFYCERVKTGVRW